MGTQINNMKQGGHPGQMGQKPSFSHSSKVEVVVPGAAKGETFTVSGHVRWKMSKGASGYRAIMQVVELSVRVPDSEIGYMPDGDQLKELFPNLLQPGRLLKQGTYGDLMAVSEPGIHSDPQWMAVVDSIVLAGVLGFNQEAAKRMLAAQRKQAVAQQKQHKAVNKALDTLKKLECTVSATDASLAPGLKVKRIIIQAKDGESSDGVEKRAQAVESYVEALREHLSGTLADEGILASHHQPDKMGGGGSSVITAFVRKA